MDDLYGNVCHYPTKRFWIHFFFFSSFSLRRFYKTARVGGLSYLRARVTLAGGLTFSLVDTPVRVKEHLLLIVISRRISNMLKTVTFHNTS